LPAPQAVAGRIAARHFQPLLDPSRSIALFVAMLVANFFSWKSVSIMAALGDNIAHWQRRHHPRAVGSNHPW
jgi:hypothetical protein